MSYAFFIIECMGPIIWLIGAGVLALAEFATMDFSLLMLATAALVTAGVATVGIPVWAEVGVFALSSLLTLLLIRPFLRKRMLRTQQTNRFDHRSLEGKKATVVEALPTSTGRGGMVRLDGELWSARVAHPGESFLEGDEVEVLKIDGTTAVVWKGP